MSSAHDKARWTRDVAPHPDLLYEVCAGTTPLKQAAAVARQRWRNQQREEHNGRLEQAQAAAEQLAPPLMRCPQGHVIGCRDCVHDIAGRLLAESDVVSPDAVMARARELRRLQRDQPEATPQEEHQ